MKREPTVAFLAEITAELADLIAKVARGELPNEEIVHELEVIQFKIVEVQRRAAPPPAKAQ